MMRTYAGLALAAGLIGACSKGEKVVSAPEAPVNPPVAADRMDPSAATAAAQTAGANSFTSDQAKDRLEAAGYSEIGSLTQNTEGLWVGPAKKDGKSVEASVDYKGVIKEN